MMPPTNPENVLPALTRAATLKFGRVKRLPFVRPGDPAMGTVMPALAGKRMAVMQFPHRPVGAGKDVEAVCTAIEELKKTARPALLLRDSNVRAVVDRFDMAWDE